VLAVPRSIAMSCDIHLNQRVQNILSPSLALIRLDQRSIPHRFTDD